MFFQNFLKQNYNKIKESSIKSSYAYFGVMLSQFITITSFSNTSECNINIANEPMKYNNWY